MKHEVHAPAGMSYGVRIEDVGRAEVDPAPDLFDVGRRAGAEVVDAADGRAFGEQGAGDAGPDESSDSGNECGGHRAVVLQDADGYLAMLQA